MTARAAAMSPWEEALREIAISDGLPEWVQETAETALEALAMAGRREESPRRMLAPDGVVHAAVDFELAGGQAGWRGRTVCGTALDGAWRPVLPRPAWLGLAGHPVRERFDANGRVVDCVGCLEGGMERAKAWLMTLAGER